VTRGGVPQRKRFEERQTFFLLTFLQRVFNGPLNEKWKALPDLTLSERLIVVPATALMFVLGIYPQLAIGLVNSTVLGIVEQLNF
jgi:NADH-quinone oxidoreductase subunit M